MDRTDIDKMIRKTEKVVIGGKEYEVIPQPMKISMPWKAKAKPLAIRMWKSESLATDTEKKERGTEFLFDDLPQLCDLVFEYCSHWPREEIEAVAMEYEMIAAFTAITSLLFPLEQAREKAPTDPQNTK
jgi:hypothetical protein